MRLEVAEDTLNQYANVDLTSLEGLGSIEKDDVFLDVPLKPLGIPGIPLKLQFSHERWHISTNQNGVVAIFNSRL